MEHYKNLSLKTIRGEKWIDIKGFEGIYAISSLGRIKAYYKRRYYKLTGVWQEFKERILPQKNVSAGYLGTTLLNYGERKQILVHRLVATHFIPNPLNLPEVNHKKGNKKDNRFFMLEWSTESHNKTHSLYILKNCKNTKKVIDIKTGKSYTSIVEATKKTKCKYHSYTVGQMLAGRLVNKTSLRLYE